MDNRKKILIIRLRAIGDVVLSTVIPYSIKLKHPECEIHYLTGSNNVKFLENCSFIDKVIAYSGNKFETIKYLYKQKYDVIISLNYTLFAYTLAFLSFPKKVVFKSLKGKSWVENYFYTAKKVYNDISLPERLFLSNKNNNCELKIRKDIEKYPKPHILLNPGRYECQVRQGRVWHIEKYKELAQKLLKTYGGTIFINGSKNERNYHIQLADENIVVLSGRYSLEETFALISLCDLIISGDSGPVHIASAFDKKAIALLGSTSPDKIKPYGKNGYFIEPESKCKYCWKRRCKFLKDRVGYSPCMESITPDMVMKKIFDNSMLAAKVI